MFNFFLDFYINTIINKSYFFILKMLRSLELESWIDNERIIPWLITSESIIQAEFEGKKKKHTEKDNLSTRIACILEWTWQTRLASAWNWIIEQLSKQIKPFIEQWLPIELLSAWWARKDKCDWSQQILDIAELTMLSTLSVLNTAIKGIYSPWLKFIIINEDVWDKYLFSDSVEDIWQQVDTYTRQLITLAKVFECVSWSSIIPINESELLKQSWLTWSDFIWYCDDLLPIFLRYIQDSDSLWYASPEDWEKLESYKELKKLWWLWVIPQEMRDFYYSRIQLIHWNDRQIWQRNLAQMFAAILKRRQLWITNFSINEEKISPIRMSFATPTPWMPTRSWRIFLRTIPRDINSSRMPYWVWNWVLTEKNWEFRPQIISRYSDRNTTNNAIKINWFGYIEANIIS